VSDLLAFASLCAYDCESVNLTDERLTVILDLSGYELCQCH
jgi:hypothetical protein